MRKCCAPPPPTVCWRHRSWLQHLNLFWNLLHASDSELPVRGFFTVCTSWLEENNTCLWTLLITAFRSLAFLFGSLFSYIGCVIKNRKQRKEKTVVIKATLVNPGQHFLYNTCCFKTNALTEHFSFAFMIGLDWYYFCYNLVVQVACMNNLPTNRTGEFYN